ncbi:MAG: Ig-like domain-containing protein, partial [Lachnospiraceae bacterium]|nr:Ig-like domain-containing protein [Lachnospiraceae bacterium]
TVNAFSDMTLAVNYSEAVEINETISNVRWESAAPEIVSVEDGVISSLSAGASTVTAYIDEVPYSFEVVATTPDITTTSIRKIIGNTEQVSILGTNGKVEWKSDNTAIATVSNTGLITAEPTGAGQSTVVHAYVDGMEFKIDVAVEPIPQLSSTYKIYGHQNNSIYKNAKITICTNANETISFTYREVDYGSGSSYNCLRDEKIEKVLNVADVDYNKGEIYPLYHAFYARNGYSNDNENFTEVYLVGTSQIADVSVQRLINVYHTEYNTDGVKTSDSSVTYEACENYGIIHVYNNDCSQSDREWLLVTASVDGYQYQFVISPPGSYSYETSFDYKYIDQFPADYMIEECSVDEIVIPEKVNVNYSALRANSKTYIPDSDWVERIGTKFVEAVEDQAIEMAAGALLKMIFL